MTAVNDRVYWIREMAKLQRVLLPLLVSVFVFAGCEDNPSEPKKIEPEPPRDIQILSPGHATEGSIIPAILRDQEANPRSAGSDFVTTTYSEGGTDSDVPVHMRRGTGLLILPVSSDDPLTIQWEDVHRSTQLLPEDSTGRTFETTTLQGEALHWAPGEVITILGEVTVPSGEELIIEPGVLVRMGALAELTVAGTLTSRGTYDSLVTFMPQTTGEAWGEINCSAGVLDACWTLFTGGGGNSEKSFGHSGSQPVLRCFNGSISLSNSFIVNNPGKAIGSSDAIVQLDSCVVSRCDTGGEHRRSLVTIENSWFFEMPDATFEPIDDDNDAGYFNGAWSGGDDESVIRRSVFVRGKDDAIDHNGANLRVEDCVIDDFDHEGVACSNENTATILNTLIFSCGQGIEAGYGAPDVVVDHCTLVGNVVGLRFGDEYLWGEHLGTLTVTNTISQSSYEHNVWDFDPNLEGPSGRISISTSMVNDPLYNSINGNLPESAVFTTDYLLKSTSPGTAMASDGLNIGINP